jgi:phenylacetate-CoA ligase
MSVLEHLQFARKLSHVQRVSLWPASRIQRLQEQRFRHLLAHTVARSPFYRARYGKIDVARIPLNQLPPVSKEELQEHLDAVFTDRRLRKGDLERYIADEKNLGRLYLGELVVGYTSGTQGTPLLLVHHRSCLQLITALMATRSSPNGAQSLLDATRLMINPKRVATIALRRGFYPSGMILEFMPRMLAPFARVSFLSSMDPELVERLNDLQPHIITAYASVLGALALQAHRLRLSNLEFIRNSSEQLSPAAKTRIESAFGVKVFDHYGTGECLHLADTCRDCGHLHVNADWAILEAVDDDCRPVPAGTVGAKVLVTNLANWIQPFIRYEVGDRVALSANGCRASHLPRIERMEGRSAEVFWVRDGGRDRFVSWALFQDAVDAAGVLLEWRAIQLQRNSVELQVQFLPGTRGHEKRIAAELSARLLEYGLPTSVALSVTIVDEVAPDPRTGKIRHMISVVGLRPS